MTFEKGCGRRRCKRGRLLCSRRGPRRRYRVRNPRRACAFVAHSELGGGTWRHRPRAALWGLTCHWQYLTGHSWDLIHRSRSHTSSDAWCEMDNITVFNVIPSSYPARTVKWLKSALISVYVLLICKSGHFLAFLSNYRHLSWLPSIARHSQLACTFSVWHIYNLFKNMQM